MIERSDALIWPLSDNHQVPLPDGTGTVAEQGFCHLAFGEMVIPNIQDDSRLDWTVESLWTIRENATYLIEVQNKA